MKQFKFFYFLFVMLSLKAGYTVAQKTTGKQPNILFILVDDLGWKDIKVNGSSFYETPNIDQLAKDGMSFTNAYAACPVCSPTRASILTGKYPARLDITDWIPGRQAGRNPDAMKPFSMKPPEFTLSLPKTETTIAEALKQANYHTYFVGKWHLSETEDGYPQYHGFDVNIAGCSFGQPVNGYFSPWKIPGLTDGPVGEYLTDRLSDECVNLIKNTPANEPFLLYYAMYQVHTPLQAKPDKIAYFEKKAKDLGITFENSVTKDKDWITNYPAKGNYAERTIQGHPVYAAMVSHMDDAVGKLINTLKQQGLYNNTIIIFTSDNGGLSTAEGSPTSNAPLKAGKGWLYEGGIKEPLIIRWPGKTKNTSTTNALVTSTDFYPSILEMAGLPALPQQHVDGVSFAPVLKGKKQKKRGAIYWHYPHYPNQGGRPCGAIRDGNYKLIENYEDMTVQLFDVVNDPGEIKDLAISMQLKTMELTNKLHKWRESLKAKMPVKK